MKWGWIIFWAVVAVFILKDPAGSAATVRHWWDSASTFITSL